MWQKERDKERKKIKSDRWKEEDYKITKDRTESTIRQKGKNERDVVKIGKTNKRSRRENVVMGS